MEKRELAKLDLEIRIGTREDTEHIVEFSYSLGMETEGDDCDKQIHRDGIQRLFENDRNETQRINNEGRFENFGQGYLEEVVKFFAFAYYVWG